MMLNRFVSFVGACGLILAVTAMVPMLPTNAAGNMGSGCNGSGCPVGVDGYCLETRTPTTAECSCGCIDGSYNAITKQGSCDCEDR